MIPNSISNAHGETVCPYSEWVHELVFVHLIGLHENSWISGESEIIKTQLKMSVALLHVVPHHHTRENDREMFCFNASKGILFLLILCLTNVFGSTNM